MCQSLALTIMLNDKISYIFDIYHINLFDKQRIDSDSYRSRQSEGSHLANATELEFDNSKIS